MMSSTFHVVLKASRRWKRILSTINFNDRYKMKWEIGPSNAYSHSMECLKMVPFVILDVSSQVHFPSISHFRCTKCKECHIDESAACPLNLIECLSPSLSLSKMKRLRLFSQVRAENEIRRGRMLAF